MVCMFKALYPTHLTVLDLTTKTVALFGEALTLWGFLWRKFLESHVTSCLLGPNILLIILLPNIPFQEFCEIDILKISRRQNSIKSSRAGSFVRAFKPTDVSQTDSVSILRILIRTPKQSVDLVHLTQLSAREDFNEIYERSKVRPI
jgi:hypothetical protein